MPGILFCLTKNRMLTFQNLSLSGWDSILCLPSDLKTKQGLFTFKPPLKEWIFIFTSQRDCCTDRLMETAPQLLQKAIQQLNLLSEVTLSTKILIAFVLALILALFALVSERCFEARVYSRRKILYGASQRVARANLPPLSRPHMIISQIPRNLVHDSEISSV